MDFLARNHPSDQYWFGTDNGRSLWLTLFPRYVEQFKYRCDEQLLVVQSPNFFAGISSINRYCFFFL